MRMPTLPNPNFGLHRAYFSNRITPSASCCRMAKPIQPNPGWRNHQSARAVYGRGSGHFGSGLA
jgi:hypothetical protein